MYKLCRAVAIVSAIVFTPQVLANGVAQEAQQLLQQGQANDALKKLDAHLAKNPQDAEARFARGLALVKLNRAKDAIRAFADLTRDYPQLPEPYNNLAVLYAAEGDYTKAREALEAALATHPSYATAHENLGDIYAALAGAAYGRALQLDQGNPSVRAKLALINQLDGVPDTTVAAVPVTPVAAAAVPAPVVAAPVAGSSASTAPVAAAAPAASSTTLDAGTQQAAESALSAWVQAWSSRDLDTYFAAYAEDFVPEGGLTRAAWETQRRDRIQRPQRISVKALEPQFTTLPDERVRVSFRQEYESDAFSDSVTKILEMSRAGSSWKITREYTR